MGTAKASPSAIRFASLAFAGLLLCCGQKGEPQDLGARAALDSAPPQRVVVIGPSSAETLVWLGLQDRIVGVSDYCAAPELAELPRVGGQLDPNLERITTLKPDLVLVQGSHPRLEAWCKQQQTHYLAWKTQSVAGWREEVRDYGVRFEIAARANVQLAEWDRNYAELAESSVPEESTKPCKVLIIASRDSERIARVLAAGRGSFLGELLEHVGGANIYADHQRDYFDLAEEAILRVQPELILELGGEQDDPQRLALWQAAFPQVPAVRTAQIYGLREDFVFLPGPRMLQTAALLRSKLDRSRSARDED